ncbi:hypothetical protein VTN96DRAFT_7922 [Rasamsonia emersonii]
MADISREERLQLALQAYKKGQFPSIQKAADAFDVPKSTLITRRLKRIHFQHGFWIWTDVVYLCEYQLYAIWHSYCYPPGYHPPKEHSLVRTG